MVDSLVVLLLIIESFLFSFDSYTFTFPNPNKKIGFIFSSSFIIRFITRTILLTHLVFYFEIFKNHFLVFLETLRTRERENVFSSFLIF